MGKVKDLTGSKFGKLTAVKFLGIENKKVLWMCECECGGTKIVPAHSLRHAKENEGTRSCGCLLEARKLPYGHASRNHLYRAYRSGARKRKHEFTLSIEEFGILTQQECFYCGRKPETLWSRKEYQYNGDYIYNGIDRKDNSIGYTTENSVTCCKLCNFTKQTLSSEEFIDLCKKIAKLHS